MNTDIVSFLMVAALISAILFLLFLVSIRIERRSLIPAILIFVLAVFVRNVVGELSDRLPGLKAAVLFRIFMGTYDILFFALPYVFAVSFVVTNLILLKREGAGVRNMLAAGAAVLILLNQLVVPLIHYRDPWSAVGILTGIVSIFCTYFIYLQYVYTLAMVLNLRHIRKYHGLEYIIVLGSGLIGSRVPPLLASRIEKGIQVYRNNPGATIIMSGGQGRDEDCPEGTAMSEYARMRGVPQDDILIEDQSTTTEENLRFSECLIQENTGHPERHPNTAVVTSAYHLLRALIMARRQKIPCIGFGALTKGYYAQNAMVREYIAFLVKSKKTNMALIGIMVLVYLFVAFGVTNGRILV